MVNLQWTLFDTDDEILMEIRQICMFKHLQLVNESGSRIKVCLGDNVVSALVSQDDEGGLTQPSCKKIHVI